VFVAEVSNLIGASVTIHLWDLPPGLSLYVFLLNELTCNSPVFFVGKKILCSCSRVSFEAFDLATA